MKPAFYRLIRCELESGTRYLGCAWNYEQAKDDQTTRSALALLTVLVPL